MPDLPEEAVQAARDGVDHEYVERHGFDHNVARAALTAAAPALAAQERAAAIAEIHAIVAEVRQGTAERTAPQAAAAERAACIAELRELADRYRRLPDEKQAAGEELNLGQQWSCHEQAQILDYAAAVLARKIGEAQ